jgi:hypothetical protein
VRSPQTSAGRRRALPVGRRKPPSEPIRLSTRSSLPQVVSDISKYTGQSVRPASFSVNDLESNRLAGIFRVIWSNLCTRHIPDKLKLRGHHDWPDNTE